MPDRSGFAGTWHIARRIEDAHAGQAGHFIGTARLTPGDIFTLNYHEEGTLHLGTAPPMRAERRYTWRFDGNDVAVLFEDGRPFHSFTAQGQSHGSDHLCGADLYRVAYDFTDFPRWSATWQVQGPRKSYSMQSLYSPA